ncbi:hypothetical protein BpHYR1_049423 [Brachionus plicatilis]|uniref:Uncharacterized protein n=1 Tax=Brachionus plicatilis TaxID=10195 RepID=A0A3M7QJA2_BRAPC|nr:hypothetical protein BpHYR1_049423 [Brachionus plicatilis]
MLSKNGNVLESMSRFSIDLLLLLSFISGRLSSLVRDSCDNWLRLVDLIDSWSFCGGKFLDSSRWNLLLLSRASSSSKADWSQDIGRSPFIEYILNLVSPHFKEISFNKDPATQNFKCDLRFGLTKKYGKIFYPKQKN